MRPATASSVASTSPASSLRSRVSTLPRNGATPTSGRSRLTKACRRGEAVPTTAPAGSSRNVLALRLMKASRGSSRGKKAGEHEPRRQHGRQILRRMHREVDVAGEQRLLDFLGEQSLAAGFGQWPILDDVAGGADDFDLDPLGVEARRGGEPALHLARLHQRQRRAARADAQDGSLAGGLCHRTFRC